MPDLPDLNLITAVARAGARAYAWRLFREAGLEGVDEASALSRKGSLLKGDAAAAEGPARTELLSRAADAYLRAFELSGDPYPLINAASLSLLIGEGERAKGLARAIPGPREGDTDYFNAATAAEAKLVLGDVTGAREALGAAVALQPRAWEDHASTLRQFELLLAVMGEDATWLEALRPPRTLHFAGHMAVAGRGEALRADVDAWLAKQRIGFGFGSLAAGADIVVAEALVGRDAELHVVLSGPVALFRERSVLPYGQDWAARFDALLAKAETVRELDATLAPDHPLNLQLAAEIAMGQAAMLAATYETQARQLVVVDAADTSAAELGGSAWSSARWEAARPGSSHRLVAPRDTAVAPAPLEPVTPLRLAALLTVTIRPAGPEALTAEVLPKLAAIIGAGREPLAPPRWSDRRLFVAYPAPADAAPVARALIEAFGEAAQVGAHYGLVMLADDPFGGGRLVLGEAAEAARRIADLALPGALQVSLPFAAALHAAGPAPGARELAELGPHEPWQLDLYALG